MITGMERLKSSVHTVSVFCFISLLSYADVVLAAEDLSTRSKALSEHFKSLAGAAQIAFIAFGLIIVGISLVGIRKAQQRQEPLGPYIGGLIVGVLLASITAFILIGSETIVGSGQSELDKLGL